MSEPTAERQELEQLRRDLPALLASARHVMTYRRFPEAARAVFDTCRDLIGAASGFASVARGDGEEVLFLEADGRPCAEHHPPPPQIAALMATARAGSAPVLENAVPGCPNMICVPWGEVAVENVLVAPLVYEGRTEGFIGLVNKPGGFTAHDVALASTFAEHAVLSLANSRALDALEESRERFRAVVEHAADAIVTADAAGLVVGWNPAAEAMFGRPAAAMLGRPVDEIIPAALRGPHAAGMERVPAEGQAETVAAVERSALGSDGAPFPIEITRRRWTSRQGVFFTAIIRDIRARKAAERSRREGEELFRAVAETSGSLLALLDREGNLQWNNETARRVLGYDTENLPDSFTPIHPDDQERVRAAWSRVMAGEGDVRGVAYRYRTAWGSYVHLESTTRRIRVGDEEMLWISSQDLTELVERRGAAAVAHEAIDGIVGDDPAMLEVAAAVRGLAAADVPVLVQGESGTGKELVAAAIHRLGPRAARGFVPVNCAALPEALLESELFGHVKGAFTGAYRDKKGRFELADGGTIFLDEVAEIPPAVQVKLLRVLQEGVFEKVGGERQLRVDVRVVSATNRNLRRETEAGRFREDLFYRLGVVDLSLPPLRERAGDIPLLIEHILGEEAARAAGRGGDAAPPRRHHVSPQALSLLIAYPWPGNVRELQNALRHAIVKSPDGTILPAHLPRHVATAAALPARRSRVVLTPELVRDALAASGGHRGKAARLLGVSRATFYRFIGAGDTPADGGTVTRPGGRRS